LKLQEPPETDSIEERKDIINYMFNSTDKVRTYPFYPFVQIRNNEGKFYISLKNGYVYYKKPSSTRIICMETRMVRYWYLGKNIIIIKGRKINIDKITAFILSVIKYLIDDYKRDYGKYCYIELPLNLKKIVLEKGLINGKDDILSLRRLMVNVKTIEQIEFQTG